MCGVKYFRLLNFDYELKKAVKKRGQVRFSMPAVDVAAVDQAVNDGSHDDALYG